MNAKVSDALDKSNSQSGPATGDKRSGLPWRLALTIDALLLGLGFLGFAMTAYAPEHSSWYWVIVLPAFAAIGIWRTWSGENAVGAAKWTNVRKQIYHWAALFLAIQIAFKLGTTGNMTGRDCGLVAMLLMGLTCVSVGVSFDWIFIPVGILLATAVLIAGWFEEYLWLVLIAVGLAAVILLALQRLATRKKAD